MPLLKKLTGGGEFCSDAHRNKYQEEYNKLALSRLLQAQAPNAGGSGNLSPRALRQLPPPAPRAGAPRALPPPSAPPAAEPKRGGFAGLFSSRKPAAIEAPAASSAPAPAKLEPSGADTPAPAAKSSIWKTFVRAERPAPPPPPEPDPAAATFLLARVEVRKPLGETLRAPISIEPLAGEQDISRPAGASAVVSLVEPIPFDWEEAYLQYCCVEEDEVAAVEEHAVEIEQCEKQEEVVAPPVELLASAVAEAEPEAELKADAQTAGPEEPLVELLCEQGQPEVASSDTEESAVSDPPLASPVGSSLVSVAPPRFALLGRNPEMLFTGLTFYPTCAAVDLSSLRPAPVREKILEPASFSGTFPAAYPRSYSPRMGSRLAESASGWRPGTPWQSWRPSLEFVPSPQKVERDTSAGRATRYAPPPVPSSEQHHDVVINLAALGIFEDS